MTPVIVTRSGQEPARNKEGRVFEHPDQLVRQCRFGDVHVALLKLAYECARRASGCGVSFKLVVDHQHLRADESVAL
jgi:hypothetical protein